ncbi:hypothetical protein D3C86_1570010 [compost metagenome]
MAAFIQKLIPVVGFEHAGAGDESVFEDGLDEFDEQQVALQGRAEHHLGSEFIISISNCPPERGIQSLQTLADGLSHTLGRSWCAFLQPVLLLYGLMPLLRAGVLQQQVCNDA